MEHKIKHCTPEEALKGKSDTELEQELKILLTMDNGGGVLADNIINELDRRSKK